MRVVIGSSHLWRDSARVGIHALGEYFLTKGAKVAWFTIPFSLLNFVKPTNLAIKQKRLVMALHPLRETSDEGTLVNYVPLSFVHPMRLPFLDSYFVSRLYLKWVIPPLHRRLQQDGMCPIDILLFDSGGLNIYYPLADLAELTIYRLNDLVSEFPGQIRGRIASEKEILKKADLVFAVSNPLFEEAVRIRGTDKGVYLLPNGVYLESFDKQWPEPDEYQYIPRPIATFVGALSSWFDWSFLREVAILRPEISFVVVGRGETPFSLPENVYLLGARPHEQVPAYLQHANAGLIIFKDLPLIRRIERPLKFYEYLAAGLPIVSVSYGSLKTMEPYALFGDVPEEFARRLDEAIEMGQDPDERARRKEVAKQFSWGNVFAKFERILHLKEYE